MTPQNQLTKEQKISRSEEAKKLLEHPLLQEAFANLRLNYFEAWTATPPDRVNERDGIYHAARVLEDVQAHLRIVVTHGRIERAQIDKMGKSRAN